MLVWLCRGGGVCGIRCYVGRSVIFVECYVPGDVMFMRILCPGGCYLCGVLFHDDLIHEVKTVRVLRWGL